MTPEQLSNRMRNSPDWEELWLPHIEIEINRCVGALAWSTDDTVTRHLQGQLQAYRSILTFVTQEPQTNVEYVLEEPEGDDNARRRRDDRPNKRTGWFGSLRRPKPGL